MLLGAAKLLKAHERELAGTVRLIFQPAEEGGAGGDLMVKEGASKPLLQNACRRLLVCSSLRVLVYWTAHHPIACSLLVTSAMSGALEGVSAIFGQHVWPFLPSGTIGSRAGPIMGACQQFEVHIMGVGGHAAMPHTIVDPVVAAASTISALQVTANVCGQPLIH